MDFFLLGVNCFLLREFLVVEMRVIWDKVFNFLGLYYILKIMCDLGRGVKLFDEII